MSVRVASVSPSMERYIRARLVGPASSCTSRRLPPTCETVRAARVMKVRHPECDEHPSIFNEVYKRWNHRHTVAGDSPPPRFEKRIGRSGMAMSSRALCNVTSAAWRSGCRGMVRPPVLPFLARLGTWSTSATYPAASVTIVHVNETMAVARRPAFIDNRHMT
jgi:hypothetical protein